MADWITHIVETLGYGGVALLMFLENIFPPIPSELIMPLAGFAAARGEMSLPWAIAAGTAGSVAGQFPLYYLGWWLGEDRLRRLVRRYGRWLALSEHDVDRAGAWFERRGAWAVLLCRLVPGIRSLISIPAGVHRMNLGLFTLCSTAGMAAWATILATAGYLLGDHYDAVARVLGPVGWVVFAVLALAIALWIGRRHWNDRRSRRPQNRTR